MFVCFPVLNAETDTKLLTEVSKNEKENHIHHNCLRIALR